MPIREESFRIGCGRYIQGFNYTEKTGEEVLRLGSAPLVVGDETSFLVAREKIEKSLSSVCNKYEFYIYTETCNDENAKSIALMAKEKGYDVIIGVGGGVICDFAKLCAYYARVPVINIPTSSATCAAYTPLSVRYTRDGETVGSMHFKEEVNCVIADTGILVKQPVRLFLSGVFDALAKFIEIKQRFDETKEYPIGLDYAYVMSVRSFDTLCKKTVKCLSDMKKGIVSNDLEHVLFTCIAATGVISGIARGSNQTALAHKFYETTRFFYPKTSHKYLHGEIVGVGLLMQNHFNGEEKENEFLLDLMKKYSMPHKITDIEIDNNEITFENYYEKIKDSSAVNEKDNEECEKFRNSLKYLWNLSQEEEE